MQDNSTTHDGLTVAQQVADIVNRMLDPFGKSIPVPRRFGLNSPSDPFDLSKPNEHDSKAEFLREVAAVEAALDGLETTIGALFPSQESPHRDEITGRLKPVLDAKFRIQAPTVDLRDSYRLIRKSVADVGGYVASLTIILDLQTALRKRLEELKDQEEKFWDVTHRPPDYHARAIALRLAQLFARETRQRPTFGTSGATGEASTSYARALRDIYKVLGIKADVRGPATWAIAKITNRDLNPSFGNETTRLFNSLFGPSPDTEEEFKEDPELEKYMGKTPLPPLPVLPHNLPTKKAGS